jgi:hypothetical protein
MSLLLTRSGNIALTIIITLTLSLLYRRLSVRLGGSIVNLSEFYSYRLIGKLTVFLQLQEFSQRNQTWEHSSTFAARLSLRCLKSRVSSILAKAAALRINLKLDGVK